jgi:hypothetical protein
VPPLWAPSRIIEGYRFGYPPKYVAEDDPLVVELGDGLLMDHMFRL